jgi:hypothetical protein
MNTPPTMPNVQQLAQELSAGQSPVQVYDAHSQSAEPLAPTKDELKAMRNELRARILFAWELARAASIKNRSRS